MICFLLSAKFPEFALGEKRETLTPNLNSKNVVREKLRVIISHFTKVGIIKEVRGEIQFSYVPLLVSY